MIGALDSIAHIAAERSLNSVVAGIMLTTFVWCLLGCSPRTNARTRVMVWLSLLVAIPGLSLAAIFIGKTPSVVADQSARIIVPEGWALTIFLGWAVIAVMALLRVVFGLWRIRRLRRGCTPINVADLAPGVVDTIKQFHPKRPVALLESAAARVPMALGFFRPAVILPSWALAELPASEISAILIHEFAHLHRWDDWTNFLQKVLRAVFFFHPSLWWLDRRLALDREIACDDAVLAATNQAHDYARCLIDLAEKSLMRRSLGLAQAAVHRVQHISVRIGEILDSTRPRATRVSKVVLAGVTALAGLGLVAVLQSPTLIAFQNAAPKVAASQPQPMVVPDSGHETASASAVPAIVHTLHPPTRAAKANAVMAHARSRDVVLPAKLMARPLEEQPKVLRAGLSVNPSPVVPLESVLFVVPDAKLDSSGRVVWTLAVWRVTVYQPVQAQVEGAISNSI